MPNINKQRGKYFEEKVVAAYRQLLNLQKHECYRASFSGARSSVELNGDISFSQPEKYPVITECKYYQNMSLENFFPICNSYIDEWLEQVQEEKHKYMSKFIVEPLVLIVTSKPYQKSPFMIIENDLLSDAVVFMEDLIETFGINTFVQFYSEKFKRKYLLTDFQYIDRLFMAFKINNSSFREDI